MPIPLFYISLLSVSCAFCSLTYTTPLQAKTIQPTTHVGTWQNKDEDGDGVVDVKDVSPFNAELSQWTTYEDVEPNNSHISANNTNNILPFSAQGIISQKEDKDTFRFKVEKPTFISVVIHATDPNFSPRAFVLGKDNSSLQAYTDISPSFGQLRFIASYQISESGTYHLSLSDEHYRGQQSYSYDVSVFEDLNVNGIADFTEAALGMNNLNKSDKDNDGAKDAAEYYVYKYDRVFAHDIDNDGIPNWEDTDSDGDSISDKREGIKDNDLDGLPSRFDLDSDNDGVLDETFATNNRLKDSDFDGEPDYRDIDDDGDLVIDLHDQNPAEKISTADLLSPENIELVNLNYNYQNLYLIPDLVIENESAIIKYNGKQSSGWLVIQFDDHFINLSKTVENNQLKFNVPYGAKSVFYTNGLYKSNTLDIDVSPKGTPLIVAEPKVLSGESPINAGIGQALIIKGDYFYPDSLIVISDKEYTPDLISINELSLELTSAVSSGELKVKTSYGYSNSVEFELVSNKKINLASEFDTIASEIIISSFTGVDYRFANGTTNINTSSYFYSGFFVKSKSGVNLPYYIYLNGKANDFTPLHLAISSVWFDLRPDQVLSKADSLNYYDELTRLKDILNLASYIRTHANAVRIIDEKYQALLKAAITAGGDILNKRKMNNGN